MNFMMLAPVPSRTFVASSGAVYNADTNGIILNVPITDVPSLQAAGCMVLTPPPGDCLGYIKAANFNTTADQIFTMTTILKYRVRRITALNTSLNGMSTAEGGIYTAASKGGSALVANTQVYTGLTNALTADDLTLALPNAVQPASTPLYFSLTTAQGAAATADLYAFGDTYQ